MRSLLAFITAGLFSLGLFMAAPGSARACMDYRALTKNEGAKLIASAEKSFSAGKYDEVLDLLQYSDELSDWRQAEKRMELVAIANVRSGRPRAGVMSLRALVRKHKDEPYLIARLAEGLSKTKKGEREAVQLLSKLAAEDLMPDAEGYAVLASLLAHGPDLAKAEAAAAACVKRASRPDTCPRIVPS